MNYLGHKSSAIALFPLILFPIQIVSPDFKIEFINEVLIYTKEVFIGFIELTRTNPLIVILSIISYWIGSTLIDLIDFKILKRFVAKNKRGFTYLYHRQWTHGFIDNLIILFLILYYIDISPYMYIGLFYILGLWTHLITDMMSGSIPIFFYGNYAKKMSRIGINRIVPKSFEDFFSKKLPKIFDKISPLITIIGIILFFTFNGLELLINPLINNLL